MSNKKATLYVLVGLPGSGKSTWTKNFLNNQEDTYVVLSTDDIIVRLGDAEGLTYNQAHYKYLKQADKEMKLTAAQSFNQLKNIIWDQTNLSEKSRRKVLSRATKDYHKVAVLFEVEEQELAERLNKREQETGKRIKAEVIAEMRQRYVEPTLEEGFHELQRVRNKP